MGTAAGRPSTSSAVSPSSVTVSISSSPSVSAGSSATSMLTAPTAQAAPALRAAGGPKGGLNGVGKPLREASDRPLVAADVNRSAARDDDEDRRVGAASAVRSHDRIPVPGLRDAGDPRLDPAEGPGVAEVVQETWGSISP